MSSIIVEQALYGTFDGGGYRFVARSPGFREDWLAEAERLCAGFGERPAGVACPAAIFAQPFGRRHVAIVQAADQGIDDAGRPGALGFHLLVLRRDHYQAFGGDQFQLADRQQPPWHARGELPTIEWPAEPLPPRTLEQTRQILKRADGPVLLGGSQVLVDGGRVVFARQQPDAAMLRDLWQLLPTRTRGQIWPATFAFGNSLRFHALAVPKAEGEEFTHYHTEEQAADYPEGRYELALQVAAESGDQRELDRLFRRRSQTDTLRLAWTILAASIVVLLLAGLFNPAPPVERKRQADPAGKKEHTAKAVPDLPPGDRYPQLNADEKNRLNQKIIELVDRTGEQLPADARRGLAVVAVTSGPTLSQLANIGLLSEGALSAILETDRLIDVLDTRLGTPDPGRIAEETGDDVPAERRLRVLLWKHGVAAYNDPRLNIFEVLERLEAVVAAKKSLP
jgi:hypothetical protein